MQPNNTAIEDEDIELNGAIDETMTRQAALTGRILVQQTLQRESSDASEKVKK